MENKTKSQGQKEYLDLYPETPSEMIRVEVDYATRTGVDERGKILVYVNTTQPTLQDYINKVIKEKGYIKREDAINEVEIDKEKMLDLLQRFFVDKLWKLSGNDVIFFVNNFMLINNPLKLKQQGEGK